MAETLSGRARELFAPLGPTYDRYARLLSFGQDPRWRRFLVSRLPVGPDDTVLDIACGTGSVALELVRQTGCSVVGVDQSPEMLAEARKRIGARLIKTERIRLVEASARELPFEDASFDGLTAAYLLRYLDDLPAGLAELARVLRPDGRLGVLEITRPKGLLAHFYSVWFGAIVPVLGKLLPGGSAYTYLPASVKRFPGPEDLAGLLREAGFEDVRYRLFAGGIVALHTGAAK